MYASQAGRRVDRERVRGARPAPVQAQQAGERREPAQKQRYLWVIPYQVDIAKLLLRTCQALRSVIGLALGGCRLIGPRKLHGEHRRRNRNCETSRRLHGRQEEARNREKRKKHRVRHTNRA